MTRRPGSLRHSAAILLLAVVGLVCAGYVLAHQGSGLPNPWANTYEINATFTAADGVVAGIGQPVDVAGVGVGSIVGTRLDPDGNAVVTMEIQRGQLPHVYADASAALEPITPLDDMRVELDPGAPPARPLANAATLAVGQTSSPTQLSDLLDAFDGNTRDYLASLIASLGQGTAGRGDDMRRALDALGPTATQIRQIAAALAGRRIELAHLVHNLARVMSAATRDRQLATVIQAGDRTLKAVAAQNVPLRDSIAELPQTLKSFRSTLGSAAQFATQLRPTAVALLPSVRRLPATLAALQPFAETGTSVIAKDVLPLVNRAQPLVRSLAAATPALTTLTPQMTSVFQVLNYTLNEFGYNPNTPANGSPDEGGLFWLAWFMHVWNTAWDTADANGAIGNGMFGDTCQSELGSLDSDITAIIGADIGLENLCPR